MNAKRRKELERLIDEMDGLIAGLEELRDQEQEAFDNLPESLQCSEKGEKMEEVINYLDDAISGLEDTIENIKQATE